jgi:hypothetical protein
MSSIPLPALAIQPQPQQPNILDQYSRILAIKQMLQNAPLQTQALQQQVQAGQLENQQRQMELTSSQALMKSFQGLDPSDPDYFKKGIAAARSTGQVMPQHLQAVMNSQLEYQGKVTDQSQKVADSLYSLGTGYLKQDDATMAQNWPAMRAKILGLEGMDPQKTQQYIPEQFPGRAQVQNLTTAVGMSAAGMRAAAQMQEAGLNQNKFDVEHGPLSQDQAQQLNQAFTQRYQIMNPGKPVPQSFQLGQNATMDDFNRIDKLMESTEKAQQTQAQQAATNAMRAQMMQVTAQLRVQSLSQQQNQQLTQSFQYSNNFLQKEMQPIEQLGQRISRLEGTLAQANPQADSLVAPELLSIMAGGSGSGLRMNEAEISRVLGGATKWTQLQGALNKWSGDPNHVIIPPVQRQQIQQLVNYVAGKANEQLNIGMQAQQDLIGATTPQEHHQILARFGQQFTQSQTSTGGQFSVTVNTKNGPKTFSFDSQQKLDAFKSEAGIQ